MRIKHLLRYILQRQNLHACKLVNNRRYLWVFQNISDHRQRSEELYDDGKEVSKQVQDAEELNDKSDKCPFHEQNQEYSGEKAYTAPSFVLSCEEDNGFVLANNQKDAYQENNVAAGKKRPVKEGYYA